MSGNSTVTGEVSNAPSEGANPAPSAEPTVLDQASAMEAFLALEKEDAPKEEPSEADAGEGAESDEDNETSSYETVEETGEEPQDSDQDAEETDEDPEEGDSTSESDDDDDALVVADDTDVIEYSVDGEKLQASVKDLKRLAGQEAKLTRKSQQTALLAEQAQAREKQAQDILSKLKEKAQARVDQFKDIDFAEAAAQGVPIEDIRSARKMLEDAQKEVAYFDETLTDFANRTGEASKEALEAKAKEAFAVITDPSSPHHIQDFGEERYGKLNAHAKALGIPDDTTNSMAEPWFWKLLDTSYRNTTAKKKLTTKDGDNPAHKKLQRTKKRVLKSRKGQAPEAKKKVSSKEKALQALVANPSSQDAAVNAFLALETTTEEN